MKKINYILLSISILIASCQSKSEQFAIEIKETVPNNSVVLTDAQFENAQLEIGMISTKNMASVLKLSGKIDVPPQNLISVSVPLGGYLKSTHLLPGMHLRKGEVIATLEDQQYIQLQQEYLSGKAKLTLIEKELVRQRELNANKANSEKLLQQVEYEFENQEILIRALEEKLKLINLNPAKISLATMTKTIQIYASISGYVSKVNVNIGKYVTPADILFEIVNPSDLHLNLTVFEKDINQLKIGQKVIAYSNANPEIKHEAEIILISKDLGQDRSAEVHCHFEKFDPKLLPGMFLQSEIEMKSSLTNALPEEAIMSFEGKDFIFITKTSREFEMIEVILGEAENGYVSIIDANLILSKKIVLKGAYTLLMALKNTSEE